MTCLKNYKDYRTTIVLDNAKIHKINQLTVDKPDSEKKEVFFERKQFEFFLYLQPQTNTKPEKIRNNTLCIKFLKTNLKNRN